MKIHLINKKNYIELLGLAKSTFIDTFAHLNNPEDFNVYLEKAFAPTAFYTELADKSSVFYGVFDENNLIGYFKLNFNKTPFQTDKILDVTPLSKNDKMLEIERIYLKKDYHGKGNAQEMMDFIVKYAIKTKYSHIWLGVWSVNLKAIRFYEKCGFEKIGEHIFDIGSDPQLDWLMMKDLK